MRKVDVSWNLNLLLASTEAFVEFRNFPIPRQVSSIVGGRPFGHDEFDDFARDFVRTRTRDKSLMASWL
ncbi:MAG: hypothetical protein DWH97_04795 [Planctomycetota bacterium]|nr:MAG: hypothetical protein DWH97_04795 [Planctomycetota bacterium]